MTSALLVAALLLTAVAAVWDLRTGHIPNALTACGLIAGCLLQLARALAERSPTGLLQPAWFVMWSGYVVVGVLACAALPYVLFRRDAMGGGDVKLLGAVGALLGPRLGLEVMLCAFIAMAAFAPFLLARQGVLLVTLRQTFTVASPRARVESAQRISYRFGPAVFIAAAWVCYRQWAAG